MTVRRLPFGIPAAGIWDGVNETFSRTLEAGPEIEVLKEAEVGLSIAKKRYGRDGSLFVVSERQE